MFFSNFKSWLAGLCVLALVGCGGGGGADAGSTLFPGEAGSGGGTTSAVLTMDVQLLDAEGVATTALVAGQPVQAKATLRRNGQVVSGEIVQFTLVQPAAVAKIDPSTGSVLTSNGVATVTLSSLGTEAGAGRINAIASVGGVQVQGSANFFSSGGVTTQPSSLALGALTIGSASVSAYGTTSLEVVVLQDGAPYTQPVTVNFTSSCPAGKGTVTPSATTQPNGRATATFVDNGCAQTADQRVTLTASIGTDTESGSVLVQAPTSGSLRFVSVVPSDKSITLRGQGGNGRQENALLTFKLVDTAGNGVGNADVCFDATSYLGGLNLDGFSPSTLPAVRGSTAICGDDNLSVVRYIKRTNADGTVSIQINSGTVPTPVRVRARALYPAIALAPLETYSDTLSISTGLPLQRSFSLSVDKANIDGGNFDGEVAVVTARLADQFSNPVPDGTVVNFIGSGAAVCTADNGSCRTFNGACSCNVVSQARRPDDHRVVVTAYAVGLEDFDDNNGTNIFDAGDRFYDLSDAYVDANKDGAPSSATINGDTDILIPYQAGTTFSASGDGVRGTAHIRASTVIYLSNASSAGDPTAVMPLAQFSQEINLLGTGTVSSNFVRLQPSCPAGSTIPQTSITVLLEDGWGNPMASGTRLAGVDASDNVAPGAPRPSVVLALGARPPSPFIDLPNLPKPDTWTQRTNDGKPNANGTVTTVHSVVVRGVPDKCQGNGSFGLEVTSPRGGAATVKLLYDGEPRDIARGAFDVRYRRDGVWIELPSFTTAGTASLFGAGYVAPVGFSLPVSGVIDWSDGRGPIAFDGRVLPDSARSARYTNTSNETKTVRLTLQFADGTQRSQAASLLSLGVSP
jgi:hypothetical protein